MGSIERSSSRVDLAYTGLLNTNYFLLKLCRCIWNLETMPMNNEDAHLSTQNLGGGICDTGNPIWLPSLFSMSLKLGGNINWRLTSELSSFWKKLSSSFWTTLKFIDVDQIAYKKSSKATDHSLIKFFFGRNRK